LFPNSDNLGRPMRAVAMVTSQTLFPITVIASSAILLEPRPPKLGLYLISHRARKRPPLFNWKKLPDPQACVGFSPSGEWSHETLTLAEGVAVGRIFKVNAAPVFFFVEDAALCHRGRERPPGGRGNSQYYKARGRRLRPRFPLLPHIPRGSAIATMKLRLT